MNSNSTAADFDTLAPKVSTAMEALQDAASLRVFGTEAFRRGDFRAAVSAFSQAAERARCTTEEAELLALVGACHRRLGKPEPALASYLRAAELLPNNPHILNGLAVVSTEAGQRERAEESLVRVIAINPRSAEAHFNLGCILQQQGRCGAAIKAYRKALDISPENADARFNLGCALYAVRDFIAAAAQFEHVVTADPNAALVWERLGFARVAAGEYDAATQAFFRQYVLAQGLQSPVAETENLALRRHNEDQARYLTSTLRTEVGATDGATAELRANECTDSVSGVQWTMTCRSGRRHVLPVAPRTGAVNANWRIARTSEDLAVIDDVLCPRALAALQDFCRSAEIWTDPGTGTEINAAIADGFFSPLLFQIAGELQSELPDLLGDLVLSSAWSYKYLDNKTRGRIHADSGAVTVNLWIAPDRFNLDRESGGMVFWDCMASAEYFQGDVLTQDTIVEALGIDPRAFDLKIVHKCNRAVVFPSRRFHQTDIFRFAEVYQGRRVNVALSFDRPS